LYTRRVMPVGWPSPSRTGSMVGAIVKKATIPFHPTCSCIS